VIYLVASRVHGEFRDEPHPKSSSLRFDLWEQQVGTRTIIFPCYPDGNIYIFPLFG
jgi:hypothetical protein